MRTGLIAAGLSVVYAVSALAQTRHPDSCEQLRSFALANSIVTSAAVVPPGPFRCAWCTTEQTVNVPAYCRVTVTIKPTADSDIGAELWMPVAEWNGKLLGLGNAN